MKVAGYIRCSTGKQDLESQRFVLTDWARKNEHQITLFEDFAISGKVELRQGLNDLMQGCKNKEFEAVAVIEISRFGRSIKIIYSVVEELTRLGIKIILANSNSVLDYNSLEGRALIGGLSLAADIEWMLISERNRRGREKIKRDNIKVGRKPSEEKGINLNAVLELRKQGKGIRETARLLNTSAPTIMRMLRRYEDGHKRNVTIPTQNGINLDEKSESVT
jgi:putative DNA-invertase from lambdoid prophage Rac